MIGSCDWYYKNFVCLIGVCTDNNYARHFAESNFSRNSYCELNQDLDECKKPNDSAAEDMEYVEVTGEYVANDIYIELGDLSDLGNPKINGIRFIANTLSINKCALAPGLPECLGVMCVQWSCMGPNTGDQPYNIGRGYPYTAAPGYSPDEDENCKCSLICSIGKPYCKGVRQND